ncbi:TIGR02221 family CRISPR-associated protein [Sphaerospermopsis aphanizomenoides BCCUSP55]|uniref:TIGR02221 family CRISPR-associated protein n=1 Tax=Sphaerospermopsis aphanizomenoides TaxID=459663 RepID=UPI001903019D|nr:TIGR02221 family CRISPR-associated protein [Sphaerospermopsis aphanizomenoides]MBK1986906.1 TIGR02221 family CRISPR-associated protein [Sphaerospermopsis aphanizomenoides BCCUSP55]
MKAISFLGFNPKKGYDRTIYISPDGNDEYETEFFQEAMVKFYKPQVLYVLLTNKAETGIPEDRTESNWSSLQKRLAGKVDLQPIKNVPESSSPEDLWKIFSLLTECLQEEDSVLFDITYGFRFLPIVALIAVSYLRIVRQVKIDGLIYGALDAKNRETNKTPIFDLLPIVSLLEWTTATDQFLKTGNAQALAGLLDNGDHTTKKLANNIDEIAKGLQLLRPIDVMEEAALLPKNIKAVSSIVSQSLPPFTTLLNRVENDYGSFGLSNPEEYQTNAKASLVKQLRMVEWYVNKGQVVQALSLAREWLPSLLCYYFNLDPRKQGHREDMEKLLKAPTNPTAQLNLVRDLRHLSQWSKVPQSKKEKLRQLWKGKYNLTKLRNDVLHAGCGEDPELAVDILNKTKNILKELKEVALAWNILP